ncbi:MAG: hypothetical protein HYY24_05330 [Verrucomicrobia bacterium]|nr:hypothetical protein [Verrucomicrobiota bacterium]
MPYVTSIQRLGREEGREKGRVQAIRENVLDVLEARFGEVPFPVREAMNTLGDIPRLKALHRLAVTCANSADFERALRS